MCHQYGKRPSEVIGIDGECTALDFDFSVLFLANKIKIKNTDGDGINLYEDPEDEMRRLETEFSQMQIMQNQSIAE